MTSMATEQTFTRGQRVRIIEAGFAPHSLEGTEVTFVRTSDCCEVDRYIVTAAHGEEYSVSTIEALDEGQSPVASRPFQEGDEVETTEGGYRYFVRAESGEVMTVTGRVRLRFPNGGVAPARGPQYLRLVSPAAPRPFQVGDRVQINGNPTAYATDGYVMEQFANAIGVLMFQGTSGQWTVSIEDRNDGLTNTIHENSFVLADGSSPAPTTEPRNAQGFGVGVVVDYLDDNTMSTAQPRRGTITSRYVYIDEDGPNGAWNIRLEDTGRNMAVYQRQLTIYDPSGAPPPVPASAIEVGTRVLSRDHARKGEVVAWQTGDAYIRRADRFVMVRLDGDSPGQRTLVNVTNAVPLVFSEGNLSEAEQLARLQALIHRVASYEAVRREWCDEVNTALAYLDLPEQFQRVDRALGREIEQNPRLLFAMPDANYVNHGDEVTTTYDVNLSLSYNVNGFQVTIDSLDISVDATGEENDDGYADFDYDLVTETIVSDAIVSAGAPQPIDYGSLDWSVDDYSVA